MKIDDATWNAIVGETKVGIARLKEAAAKYGKSDVFAASLHELEKHIVLVTEHACGRRADRKAVAREIATGELRKAQVIGKDKVLTAKINYADPEGWAAFAGKTAAQIVRDLTLTSYVMFVDARVTQPTTATSEMPKELLQALPPRGRAH
jgi:hypothetical protein